jgi:hypothetical protein
VVDVAPLALDLRMVLGAQVRGLATTFAPRLVLAHPALCFGEPLLGRTVEGQ